MKKLLTVLLMCAVSAGLYAEFEVSLGVEVDFGASLFLDPDEKEEPEWYYNILNPGTYIKGAYEGNNISSWIMLAGTAWSDNGIIDLTADATVSINDFNLSIGRDWMPWSRWSSMDFWADNNWDFGASGAKDIYIKASFMDIYLGINEAGLVTEAKSGDQSSPGFFAGYDYEQEDVFALGIAFAGVPRTKRSLTEDYGDEVDKGKFPFMANIYGSLDNIGPASLGLNLSFYGSPAHAENLFCIAQGRIADIVAGPEALVLEAMLDVGIDLEPVFLGFSAALVSNFKGQEDINEDPAKSFAMQLGFNAIIDIGNTGFSILPGLFYWNKFMVHGVSSKQSGLDLGITFKYSFKKDI